MAIEAPMADKRIVLQVRLRWWLRMVLRLAPTSFTYWPPFFAFARRFGLASRIAERREVDR
jgi:hypothetical protein